MGKKDLQCLFIGERSKIYNDLLGTLKELDLKFHVKLANAEKKDVARRLKKLSAASLIFISDDVPFSVEVLSDLVWQYASDAIVIIVTEKTISTPLKTPFDNTQFSKLHFNAGSTATKLHLLYLVETIQVKRVLRRCKRLLGVSEKKCQWLVDASNEPIAFISRDLHLYANTAYLGLFDIDSVHAVPAIPVKDLIVDDEHDIFDGFINNQILRQKLNRSLVLSFRKTNGKIFRANVHAIPSVFKGNKCLQLWVNPLNKYEFNQMKDDKGTSSRDDNLAIEQTNKGSVLEKRKVTPASILRGIIKRKEATISAQKLVEMNPNETRHKKIMFNHIVSLKVPVAQREGIDDLLFSSRGINQQENRQIFWDKVKLTRLLQTLMRKKTLNMNLFVRLSEESLANKSFLAWLLPGLRRIGDKASHLTFLLPSECSQNQAKSFMDVVDTLRVLDCQIALDNFSASERSLWLLKYAKPSYVRLSLPWVKQIEGNSVRELALASFIRQLEAKNIKVIAPCGFSKDMRKLFSLSGASFCQEKTLKTA